MPLRFASLARFLPVAAIALTMSQGALAQSTSGPSSAKLGGPEMAVPGAPLPDPGTLFTFAGDVGRERQFVVVGSDVGTVWGDGVYTSDSVLAVAAVHAGLLEIGETGIVSVALIEGLDSYEGSTRNGITSLAYRDWDVAYRFSDVERINSSTALPDPGDLSAHRGQNGTLLTFQVTGDTGGSVWGDGIYTDDSELATAAVHAGALQAGQTGLVQVEILPGQESYIGAERNGVSAGTYAGWPGSYRVVPFSLKASSKLSNIAGQ